MVCAFHWQSYWTYSKESFNSDGQQFHQYQQNVQPPFTSKQLNIKKTTTYSVTNPGPDLGQYKNVKQDLWDPNSFQLTSHCSLSLMQSANSREATNTNFIIFGLTRLVLEPTIYCTRGEHTNHYTTDAVKKPRTHLEPSFCYKGCRWHGSFFYIYL